MNLKNTCGENSNLRLKQGAAMKAGFCGIDQEQVMSPEKQVAEAPKQAERGGRLHRLVQALVMVTMKLELSK